MTHAQRIAIQTVATQLLSHLHVPYLGAMTRCTLRRLVYLASFGPAGHLLKDVPFSLGRDMHGDLDILSPMVDAVIDEMLASGIACPGEQTEIEIGDAGQAYLASLPRDGDLIATLGQVSRITSGYEGPYGSRLMALARHYHAEHGEDAPIALATDAGARDIVGWTRVLDHALDTEPA